MCNNARSSQGQSRKCVDKLTAIATDVVTCKAETKKCGEKLVAVASNLASCKGELCHSSTQETIDANHMKAFVR